MKTIRASTEKTTIRLISKMEWGFVEFSPSFEHVPFTNHLPLFSQVITFVPVNV